MCEFVASTAEDLKHQTIKSYFAAVRYMQILAGWGDLLIHSMPLVEYVLRGVKSEQAKNPSSSQQTRLPITPAMLKKVRHALWAVYCTAFFEFLRSGEVTVPSLTVYDPGAHLSYGDITFNSQTHPTLAQVNI